MIYLLLSLLSSACITVVMRLSQNHIRGQITMLTFNYLSCMLLAMMYIGLPHLTTCDTPTLTLGVINGFFYQ